MPGLFSWHLRISLEHLQQHSPSLLLAQADPSWDNDRTPSQKSLSATYNPLITTAQGEWCQGSGMCDAVLWRCTVCVCVCVWREERRGGAVPNSEKVKVRERRCSPTTEKCEKQGGKMWSEPEEEGRRWLGVVNDFARRSQTALARLGGVGNNASLCQALTNQPCALKMKKRKKNRLHWLQRADWESHACKTWHAQEACEMRYGYSSTEVNDAREVLHQRNTIDETKYLTTQRLMAADYAQPA